MAARGDTATAREAEDVAIGIVGLTSGETYQLRRRARDTSRPDKGSEPASPGGVIYTESDMPTLEALLKEHQVAVAILEQAPPQSEERPPSSADIREEPATLSPRRRIGPWIGRHGREDYVVTQTPWRIATAGALAGAVVAIGVVLLVTALIPGGLEANPYIALSLTLGGATFVASLVTALRQ